MGIALRCPFLREGGLAMRKLMWFTIGFSAAGLSCGYFLQRQYYLPVIVCLSLLLVASLLFWLKWKQARLPVAVFLGAVIGFSCLFLYDEIYLSSVRNYDGQTGYVEFVALEDAKPTQYGSVVEASTKLDGKAYTVRVYINGEAAVSLGDTLAGAFTLHSCLPGGSRENSYNRGNSIFMTASAGKEITVQKATKLPVICWPAYIRQEITGILDGIFPEDVLGFARALLLGDTELIDYETDTAFKVSGIRHVIAVSGMHVTILFAVIYFLAGRRKLLVALLGLPTLLLFAAVVGFSPSISRACLMHGIMILSMLASKEYDGPTSLSFAVLVMLLLNPYTAANVGFQLSAACMMGIFGVAERTRTWLLSRRRLGRYPCKRLTGWFATSVSVSIGATVLTTPLCAVYFGTVSLVGVVTNLLTLWVITYIFYGIMLAVILGIVWLPLGVGLAWLVAWPMRYVLGTAKLLAKFPLAAVYTDSVYVVCWLLFSYILLGIYLLYRKKQPVVFGCCCAIGLCLAVFLSWFEIGQEDFRMTVLDVGQGQCILLQSDGKNYLVDCGGDSNEGAADSAARLLLSQGIDRLDGLILTHYDRDHAGGAAMLLSRIPADVLYLPNCPDDGTIAESLEQYDEGMILHVNSQHFLTFGGTKITLVPSDHGNLDNENGLCVLFQAENCDILITGDRSEDGELELMNNIDLPDLEVLIGGHHGSKCSTSTELLEKTRPELVIFSAGQDNPYGHPSAEVLERLSVLGSRYCCTSVDGTIVYRG